MARKASRWLAVGLAMAVVPMLVPGSSAAKPGKFTATYIATPAISWSPPGSTGLAYGYGGYYFDAIKGKPTYIKVEDVDGPNVAWVACQEGPKETGEQASTCGDGDDVSVSNCSNNRFQKLRGPWRKNLPVRVFIFVNNPGIWVGANCDGIAVGGTVTLKWR